MSSESPLVPFPQCHQQHDLALPLSSPSHGPSVVLTTSIPISPLITCAAWAPATAVMGATHTLASSRAIELATPIHDPSATHLSLCPHMPSTLSWSLLLLSTLQ